MFRWFPAKCPTILLVVFMHLPVWATEPFSEGPDPVPDFIRCRSLLLGPERLACFDQAATAMEQALSSGELLLIRKTAVQEARKSRFGLPERDSDGLGGKDPDELTGVIRTARSSVDGWLIVLQDNSTWQQIGAATLAVEPRAGLEVKIKRAALGSYRLVLSPHAAFKVRRVR